MEEFHGSMYFHTFLLYPTLPPGSLRHLNGSNWTKSLISKLLHITHLQWIYHNFTLHDKLCGTSTTSLLRTSDSPLKSWQKHPRRCTRGKQVFTRNKLWRSHQVPHRKSTILDHSSTCGNYSGPAIRSGRQPSQAH